jgi:hypothetical protein
VSIKLDINHIFDTMVVAKDKVLCGSEIWTSVHPEKKLSYPLKKVDLHELKESY